MSHPNAVAVATPATSKSFLLASLAPLAGLLLGSVALYFSDYSYESTLLLGTLGEGEWSTGISLGSAACGAILASWALGAIAKGRRVPVLLLLSIPGAIWLVGVAMSFWELFRLFALMPSLRGAMRPTLFAGGMYLASLPLLIGALMASGLLLSMSLALAFSSAGALSSERRVRSALLRGLAAVPLMGIPLVASFKGAAHLAWILAGLTLPVLVTWTLASVAARSKDDRVVQLANRAVWLGAVGLVTGCVALLSVAPLELYEAISISRTPYDMLYKLSWGAGQLGAMRWATGATLLACAVLATGFTLVTLRREGGVGVARAALIAVGSSCLLLLAANANVAFGWLAEARLFFLLQARAVPPGLEPMRLPGAHGNSNTDELTQPVGVADADITLVPSPLLETDQGRQQLKEQLGEALPRARARAMRLRDEYRSDKPSPVLSVALDARVPMSALALLISEAREAGAEGLFFIGQSSEHDDPSVRAALRSLTPGLERALDAPLGVSLWFAPPNDERASERLLLRAQVTGEGAFEVGPIEGEGPSFQVDPARERFCVTDEPDTALELAPSGPAPVVMLGAGSAPSATSFLRAASALRACGFHVVLEG